MTTTATRHRVKGHSKQKVTAAARAVEQAKAALGDGDYLRARRLVAQGLERFPRSAHLRRLANLIAPPVVRVGHSDVPEEERRQTVDANSRWFRDHSAEYCGQWVAVEDGVLLASGSSVAQLQAQLPVGSKPLITMIF